MKVFVPLMLFHFFFLLSEHSFLCSLIMIFNTQEKAILSKVIFSLEEPSFFTFGWFSSSSKKKIWLHRNQKYGLKRFDIFMTPFNTEKNECFKITTTMLTKHSLKTGNVGKWDYLRSLVAKNVLEFYSTWDFWLNFFLQYKVNSVSALRDHQQERIVGYLHALILYAIV